MFRIAVHVSTGLGIVCVLFPRCKHTKRNTHIHRWSRQLTRMLGLQIKICGVPPQSDIRTLILANHISWVDIFALNAVSTARFVAKSEVASWPLIGQLCKGTGTLFIERGNKRDTVRLNKEIIAGLEAGQSIAVFPEGTTSDGSSLHPFRSALLQPAIECGATIQPIYLRYLDASGNPSRVTAYFDDITFGTSMWQVLGAKGITVELHYLPALSAADSENRHSLSKKIEDQIRAKHLALNPTMPDNRTTPELGIPRHHPSTLQ